MGKFTSTILSRWAQLSALSLLMISAVSVAEWVDEEHTYARLLTSDNPAEVKLGAKTVYNNVPYNSELLTDLTAEVMWAAANNQIRVDEDTAAWLAKALGKTTKMRYQQILQQAEASSSSRKMDKYIDSALAHLSGQAMDSYIAGTLSIPEVKQILAEELRRDQAQRNSNQLGYINNDETIAAVHRKLGLPDQVNVSYDAVTRGWGIYSASVKLMQMQYVYENVGTVRFKRDITASDNGWYVDMVTSYNVAGTGGSRAASIRQRLSTTNGASLRNVAKTLYNEKTGDEAALDEVAQRIYRSMQESGDGTTIDALAWLCRVLEQARNPRYRDVLQQVQRGAAHSKLRRYAERALAQTPAGDVAQFMPN